MIAIVDVETTGLDPATSRVIEVGAQLVSDDFKEVHASLNLLVWDGSYPAITSEIEELTGISEELLMKEAVSPAIAMGLLQDLLLKTDMCAAYNAEFDYKFLAMEMSRVGLIMPTKWVCAMVDHKPNYKLKSWKLMHVALDHGVPVDPTKLHRAIADVELTRQMLVASGATVRTLLDYRESPWVYLRAKVKKPWDDNGASTQLAKDHGFSWEKCKGDSRVFDKMWVKRVKEIDLKEQQQLPFETVQIGSSL